MSDVYEKLRQRLDDMATGYPPSANGVEIKILEKLFSRPARGTRLAVSVLPEVGKRRVVADEAEVVAKQIELRVVG